MRYYLFCCLTVLLHLSSHAQEHLDRAQLSDSVRQLIIRAEETLKTNPGQSEQHALLAHTYTKKLNDVKGQAEVSFLLGKVYFFLHKDDLSLQAFNHSADLYLQLNDSTHAALSLNGSGNVFMQKKKNFTEALKRYQQASELLQGDSVTAIRVLNNMGTIYNRTGRYYEALEIYQRVYKVAESQKDLLNMSASLNNIGSVYSHLENYEASVEYCLRSIEIKEAYNDFSGIANALTNVGIAYSALKNYEASEKALNRSLAIAQQYAYTDVEIYASIILAGLYADTKRMPQALDIIRSADRLSRRTGVTFHNGSIYKKFSEMYRLTGHLDSALYYQKKYGHFTDSVMQQERKSMTNMVASKATAESGEDGEDSKKLWNIFPYLLAEAVALGIVVLLVIRFWYAYVRKRVHK